MDGSSLTWQQRMTGPGRLDISWTSPIAERKIRLWGVACLRRLLPLIDEGKCPGLLGTLNCGLEAAEQYADERIGDKPARLVRGSGEYRPVDPSEWNFGHQDGKYVKFVLGTRGESGEPVEYRIKGKALRASDTIIVQGVRACLSPGNVEPALTGFLAYTHQFDTQEEEVQAALFRDIFGPPLEAKSYVGPEIYAFHNGLVGRMARSVHDEGKWDEAPVIADAMEDAGCDSYDMLDSLRQRHHVRGQWVIDAILRKPSMAFFLKK